jgi:hypothetical protein
MNRRSKDRNGWVNFPVDDPKWSSTNEGGMFVKLVVCDDREFDEQFGICCGVHVHDLLSEQLINDDQRPYPTYPTTDPNVPDFLTKMEEAIDNDKRWEEYHYPHANHFKKPDYHSRAYLCSMVLGSTGWSGHNDNIGLWHCTYADLTEDGKSLYNTIQQLYPGCKLHLLTFLDT